MNYVIGTAYHYASEKDKLIYDNWQLNTLQYADKFFCISTVKRNFSSHEVIVDHNLGHIWTMFEHKTKGLSGWSAHMITLAMLAYSAGKDFIYKESDCFWFGDVPGQMYKEIGEAKLIFGKQMKTAPLMKCSQSTFLLKWDYIPKFVSDYLALGDDIDIITEDKFVKLEELYPGVCARFSFGVDRERPIPYGEAVWAAQQVTEEEIGVFRKMGMLYVPIKQNGGGFV